MGLRCSVEEGQVSSQPVKPANNQCSRLTRSRLPDLVLTRSGGELQHEKVSGHRITALCANGFRLAVAYREAEFP